MVLCKSACTPVAVLLAPVVLLERATTPWAVLLPPVELLERANAPVAVFRSPVVLTTSAALPVADFDSISQTVVTTPGAFYNLSFFYQIVEPNSPPNNGLRVLFNGVVVYENLNSISGFSTFTFTHLQATGSTTTVEFQGRNVAGSDYLDDVSVTASCVQGQGYWKNHPDQWPVSQLLLGNNAYDKEQLLSILHQPVRGNGLVLLAYQLIAAKLNIANGADGSCIAQTLADADALIGSLLVPPVGTGYLRPRDVSALADTLDSYNKGGLCAPACDH